MREVAAREHPDADSSALDRRPAEREARPGARRPPRVASPAAAIALQRSAGNGAVASAIAAPLSVQRDDTTATRTQAPDEVLFWKVMDEAKTMRNPKKTPPKKPVAVTKAFQKVEAAAGAWRKSPDRKLGTPLDTDRRKQVDAVLAELRWMVDAKQVAGAALHPNPALKSSDATGYFVSTKAPLYLLKPDGSLNTTAVHLTADFTFVNLGEQKVGSKKGFAVPVGGKTYFIPKGKVIVKHAKFEKVSGPLFAKDPSPDDVKQTTLGDCYLQASVASLAARNPSLIKAMMHDNRDGTVTVRLYRVDETDQAAHKYTPEYVRVAKSVPKNFEGQAIYNEGALWVRLIEKAYAAGGFTGTGAAAPPKVSYEGIAEGTARYATEVLTGEQSQQFLLSAGVSGPQQAGDKYATPSLSTGTKGLSTSWNWNFVDVPWSPNEELNYATAKAADNYANLLSFQILKDKAKVDTWIAFVKTNKIKDMFDRRKAAKGQGLAGDITLKDFDDLLTANLGADVKDPVMQWIEQSKLYPGVLGSAKYSKLELDMFAKIQETLDRGGIVTGGTHKYPGGQIEAGGGISGGEVKSKGMVGGHAFSILGYRANSGQDPADLTKSGDLYFVKIRNPWGTYGRKYDFSKGANAGEAVEGGTGVSWLELSDLTRFFESINIG